MKELIPTLTSFGYVIHYEGGGQLPKELSGTFTDKPTALNAIQLYLSKKPKPKAKTKANADSKDVSNEE